MSFSPKRQIICETKNANTLDFYIFHEGTHSVNYMLTSGTHTVDDGIGLVATSPYGYNHLPLGKYWFHAEAVIEITTSGRGTWYTFGNISGTTPSLTYSALYSNPDVIRSINEYTIGSKDYVRTSLSFELTKTAFMTNNMLSAQMWNAETSVPYQKIVVTKID